uniref:MADS-box domain-containing protein n=1 Tax=Hemiselmis andersenii TaxID=464988 RepID=A0A6T8G7T8_HEMAN|mmetsp:Transcript_233/g.524  ORF Transcript_233/g.524 Transcript_233/m.524 type:complete len:489 (+) Transcript_233:218-1684(+)
MPPSKVRIERIEGHRMRQNTFHKRKLGLIKKAIELTVLTDCDCAIILRSGATSTCKEGRLMAYCNKDIQTMLAECQPTLSTIQHFTNNEYSRFSKDKDAIGQVAQAISSRSKKASNSKLQPSPALIHEQAMAAISLEDDDESDELSPRNDHSNADENEELKKRLSQLEAEIASLRAAAPAAQAPRRRASESVRRPLPPPIATNWASGPSASAPAGSKRMLSPSIIAPTSSSTSAAAYPRSPSHSNAIQTPEELVVGSDTPNKGGFAGLPQFKKIRQGASPESLQPLDFAVKRDQLRPADAPGAGLVQFSPSHFAGMPQQPRSSDGMMLLCSPTSGAPYDKPSPMNGYDKPSPMNRGVSGFSPRVLLQPPSSSVYQFTRPTSGRGMSMDLQAVFGAQAQAANAAGFGQQAAFPPPPSGQGEGFAQDSSSALSGFDTVGREDSWSLEQLLAPTQAGVGGGRPPLSPAHGLCTPLGRGPAPLEGACAGLRV